MSWCTIVFLNADMDDMDDNLGMIVYRYGYGYGYGWLWE